MSSNPLLQLLEAAGRMHRGFVLALSPAEGGAYMLLILFGVAALWLGAMRD